MLYYGGEHGTGSGASTAYGRHIQGVSQFMSNIPEIGLEDQNKCEIPIKVDGWSEYVYIFHLTVRIHFVNKNVYLNITVRSHTDKLCNIFYGKTVLKPYNNPLKNTARKN